MSTACSRCLKSFESFPRKNGVPLRTCLACCVVYEIFTDESRLEISFSDFSSYLNQLFNGIMEDANPMPHVKLYFLIYDIQSDSSHTILKNLIEEHDGFNWRYDMIF